MMIEGPFGITVICTSVEQNNNANTNAININRPISLLENILQNQVLGTGKLNSFYFLIKIMINISILKIYQSYNYQYHQPQVLFLRLH